MIEVGKTYEVSAPFIREVYERFGEDGPYTILTWRPGVLWEDWGPDGGSSQAFAHGLGRVVYRVVEVAKLPKPYPTRVFFVRTWQDPDGKAFGKKALRVMTAEAFSRRISGYHCAGTDGPHDFIVEDISEDQRIQMLRSAA